MQRDAAAHPATAGPHPAEMLQAAFAHYRAGQLADAESMLRQLLERSARNAEALHLLGIIAGDRGDHAGAVALIEKAIRIDDTNHGYHANLGHMRNCMGYAAAAERCYRRAAALKPDCMHFYHLGNTLVTQQKFAEAAKQFRRAIDLNPDLAGAHQNLASLLHREGRFDEAESSLRRALALAPDQAEAHNGLGAVLKMQGRQREAIACYERALALQPGSALAHINLGSAFQDMGDLRAAIDCFRRALALEADVAPIADSSALDRHVQASIHDTLLYVLSISDATTAEQYLAEARAWAVTLATGARPFTAWTHRSAPGDERPLRVGFVSADLRMHPVGFFLESILGELDRRRIEPIAYSLSKHADDVTARLAPRFAAWHSLVDLDSAAAARRIHADGIDILLDLNGHTAGNRLAIFAWKPAPLQVAWLGYWASTALPTMDYIIGDPWSIPPDEAGHFTERPWNLPETRLCFTPPRDDIAVGPLPLAGNGHVTFGCFNNPTKMNDRVVALWARVLQRIDGSRLVLKSKLFREASTRELMLQRFAAHGIAAARLELQGPAARAQYLAAFGAIDIALDTFPFAGGTTSIEGLWMGVPFITRRGDRMIGHQGESILHNMDMADWIADDDAHFVELAVAHAADAAGLAALRAGLRDRLLRSPLCDAPRFARHFEQALRQMYDRCAARHAATRNPQS